MAYNQAALNTYRVLREADPGTGTGEASTDSRRDPHGPYTPSVFRSRTCPYCTGLKDATVKHQHPETKPDSPWAFWRHVLVEKYKATQSERARANMARRVPVTDVSTSPSPSTADDKMFVVGPMVDQSELPFRLLCRQYGATLTYTPMLHAKLFRDGAAYRKHYLTTTPCDEVRSALAHSPTAADADEGAAADEDSVSPYPTVSIPHLIDRPVVVQFCGNDAEVVLEAARLALYEDDAPPPSDGTGTPLYRCDAVDLNLGCPQGIAKRGHYGSFLMEDWEAIHTIIHTLHVELEVPVTAKIRVFDLPPPSASAAQGGKNEVDVDNVCYDEALTIEYARMVRDAGAQLICIHGRTRAMKGQQSGLANMALIGRVREALEGSVPVLSNGNVLAFDDVMDHLRTTQCEGHMCAEPLLWEPRLFADPVESVRNGRLFGADKVARLAAIQTALEYLAWVRRCPVDVGFVKTHLFKMCHHSYELHSGFRDQLGRWGTARRDEDAVEAPGTEEIRTADPAEVSDTQSSSMDVETQLRALETHLYALRDAEMACAVEGEQPKTAHAEKQKARAEVKDVLEEEGDEIGFGLLF